MRIDEHFGAFFFLNYVLIFILLKLVTTYFIYLSHSKYLRTMVNTEINQRKAIQVYTRQKIHKLSVSIDYAQ